MNSPFLCVADGLLRCYPRRWRDRYEEEFRAVLEECPATFPTLFDVARGALDAHLHYGRAARRAESAQRVRRRRAALAAAGVLVFAGGGAVCLAGPFRPARALLP